ncbi:8-oxo-dGTP pyrophosphatase MutT (NUDIX family) [Thermocatellispora tengchongensis]|uniref:8-oxo-dGTP pyrophosphatase MutT (NUDIX family) n=1 Tax=Thermocatellispora tengchongensis TaxID=1073253 RepID=A0A840PE18_9ACTN|nr:8-oxo-dGTP pyrophosphatase MutT (NUDIX family) [Thermocatellispora tengchongensis]
MIREVIEETGCDAVVERLLGVDSRVIPAAVARAGTEHQNVGIFYRIRITGGRLRPEPDGETAEPVWTAIPDVARLRRSSLVEGWAPTGCVGDASSRDGPGGCRQAGVVISQR